MKLSKETKKRREETEEEKNNNSCQLQLDVWNVRVLLERKCVNRVDMFIVKYLTRWIRHEYHYRIDRTE